MNSLREPFWGSFFCQRCPELIYLEIPNAGWHEISFSMREDGFEFDKWIMSQTYEMPEGAGPAESAAKF